MSTETSQLWDAHRHTTFQADTPVDLIATRIGVRSPEVDELLRRHDANEWAFITAHNPASEVLPADENQKRHAEIEADIRARSLIHFQGAGIGADPAWQPRTC